jgi:hypothetical protein
MKETNALMSHTVHHQNWLIYHDGLSLITDRSCIEWFKSQTIRGKTFLKRWILPQFETLDFATKLD